MTTIGFIGFGEVASIIGEGLIQNGIDKILAYDVNTDLPHISKAVIDYKHRLEMVKTNAEMADRAEIIIAAVPGNNDRDVYNDIKNHLRRSVLYVDLCTTIPELKIMIAAELANRNILFADAAILGYVGQLKYKVPIIVSGTGAAKFAGIMRKFNMDVTAISSQAGMASQVKMCRSIFMKGLAALIIETMTASEKCGIKEHVINTISKTMDNQSFSNHVDRLITGTAYHATRRVREIQDVLEFEKYAGGINNMTQGSLAIHTIMAEYERHEKKIAQSEIAWIDIINEIIKFNMTKENGKTKTDNKSQSHLWNDNEQ
jgi:3-hydroxyisobutyrate dehydrogenase-like beta-hydroxyacid dehydrogenase